MKVTNRSSSSLGQIVLAFSLLLLPTVNSRPLMMNLEPPILAIVSRAVIRMVMTGALLVSTPHALRTLERLALEVLVVSS